VELLQPLSELARTPPGGPAAPHAIYHFLEDIRAAERMWGRTGFWKVEKLKCIEITVFHEDKSKGERN